MHSLGIERKLVISSNMTQCQFTYQQLCTKGYVIYHFVYTSDIYSIGTKLLNISV